MLEEPQMSLHLKLFQTDTEAGMDKITINCDIFLRQQHSSRLLPAVYWPCFTRNIFLIQSLTHLLYPTMKNINISTKTQKKSSFYRRNNKIFQTICFAFANACAVRSTYSFLYVWDGLSRSLRFLPTDRRLGERDCNVLCILVPRALFVPVWFRFGFILVPRALLTRGATRGSGQIHNRIPQKHGKKTMSGVRTSQSDVSSEYGFGQSPSSHRA